MFLFTIITKAALECGRANEQEAHEFAFFYQHGGLARQLFKGQNLDANSFLMVIDFQVYYPSPQDQHQQQKSKSLPYHLYTRTPGC